MLRAVAWLQPGRRSNVCRRRNQIVTRHLRSRHKLLQRNIRRLRRHYRLLHYHLGRFVRSFVQFSNRRGINYCSPYLCCSGVTAILSALRN